MNSYVVDGDAGLVADSAGCDPDSTGLVADSVGDAVVGTSKSKKSGDSTTGAGCSGTSGRPLDKRTVTAASPEIPMSMASEPSAHVIVGDAGHGHQSGEPKPIKVLSSRPIE